MARSQDGAYEGGRGGTARKEARFGGGSSYMKPHARPRPSRGSRGARGVPRSCFRTARSFDVGKRGCAIISKSSANLQEIFSKSSGSFSFLAPWRNACILLGIYIPLMTSKSIHSQMELARECL
eukprot:scaffold7029_cov375-Pinguiococcus_pyrenoidosus.AAC.11